MTIFESIKSKNIDEFAEWLDKYGIYDDSPWNKWWDKNYCQKCEAVTIERKEYARITGWRNWYNYCGDIECAWCEINKKCKYFQDLDYIPDNEEIIKIWLKSESD